MTPSEPLRREVLMRELENRAISVYVYENLDSTNSEAKRFALDGGDVPAVFLAEKQSAGRGRMGRSFYSPAQTGIYLSFLTEWNPLFADSVGLTAIAAVAVRRAIAQVTGISVQIKWVNDLYANGKKVCGILAESFWKERRQMVVIGVGVNVYTEEFPDALRQTAGGLLPSERGLRNRLAARIAAELYEATRRAQIGTVSDDMREYRKNSLVLGKPIAYTENGVRYLGTAQSVDDCGRLTVLRDDGTVAVLASGEISLRLLESQNRNRTGDV